MFQKYICSDFLLFFSSELKLISLKFFVNFIENFQNIQSTAAEFKLNSRLDTAGTGLTSSEIPVEFKAVSDLPNLSCWVQKA